MGREIDIIRACDVVVFAGGRSGTLGELAIAYDAGKMIGVLLGTGGIADAVDQILGLINKTTSAVIRYDNPDTLLDELETVYNERIFPIQARMLRSHNLDGVPGR